jgi:hypothetical protein
MKSHQRTFCLTDRICEISNIVPHAQFNTFFQPAVKVISLIKATINTTLHLRQHLLDHWPRIVVDVTLELKELESLETSSELIFQMFIHFQFFTET